MRAVLIGTVLALWLVPVAAWAETSAFTKLPPGDQKVARALFTAQTTGGAHGAAKPLTLDQIAARRQAGAGWGEVFKAMKARGLLTQKSLGEVVSGYERSRRATRVAALAVPASRAVATH